MKHFCAALLFLLFNVLNIQAQQVLQPDEPQRYFQEAINYLKSKNLNSKKDYIIINTFNEEGYYAVTSFEEEAVTVSKFDINKLKIPDPQTRTIPYNSISDLVWIRNKEWTGILNTIEDVGIKKLKAEFDDSGFNEIRRNYKAALHLNEVYRKHGGIKIYVADKVVPVPVNGSDNVNYYKMNINYPSAARMSGTQGEVKIGYVLLEDCTVGDVFIFEDPGYGCAQSVIESLMGLHKQINEATSKTKEVVYVVFTTQFTLM